MRVMHRDLGAGALQHAPETEHEPDHRVPVERTDGESTHAGDRAQHVWGHDAFAPHLLLDRSAVDEFIHPGKLPVADRFVHTALTIALKGAAKRADLLFGEGVP